MTSVNPPCNAPEMLYQEYIYIYATLNTIQLSRNIPHTLKIITVIAKLKRQRKHCIVVRKQAFVKAVRCIARKENRLMTEQKVEDSNRLFQRAFLPFSKSLLSNCKTVTQTLLPLIARAHTHTHACTVIQHNTSYPHRNFC